MTPTHTGTNTDFHPTGYSGQTNPLPRLKPCPFCGSTDVHLIENDRGRSEVSITCKDCNVWVDHMFDAMTREQAIELWNRRAKEC